MNRIYQRKQQSILVPKIKLFLIGNRGKKYPLECLVDTGFEGFIIIPSSYRKLINTTELDKIRIGVFGDVTQSVEVIMATFEFLEVNLEIEATTFLSEDLDEFIVGTKFIPTQITKIKLTKLK
jgi:predicted aspartyl protease